MREDRGEDGKRGVFFWTKSQQQFIPVAKKVVKSDDKKKYID